MRRNCQSNGPRTGANVEFVAFRTSLFFVFMKLEVSIILDSLEGVTLRGRLLTLRWN